MKNELQKLNTCGCCEGTKWLTPLEITNRPGLSALVYRAGDYGSFKESMLRSLSAAPALRRLTTRDDDDAGIALIDAWAVVLDVLTFYQERIVQEGFLNTSTERLSLFELARHISYRPQPGVAAGTPLAFFLDELKGAPTEITIPVGTKVQSIPGQDERPQMFETIREIRAKARWNAIKPKLREKQVLLKGTTQLYLQGTANQLQPGDHILLAEHHRNATRESEIWKNIRTLETVSLNHEEDYTLVTWTKKLDFGFSTDEAVDHFKVYVFRQKAAFFGHNAPDWRAMSDEVKKNFDKVTWEKRDNWPGFVSPIQKGIIYLDAIYPKIVEGSWIALVEPAYTDLFKVSEVRISSQTNFTLTAKTSMIRVEGNTTHRFDRRSSLVLTQSEELKIAEKPITTPVFGKTIPLHGEYRDLVKGQSLIVSGATSLTPPEYISELAIIQSVTTPGNDTEIQLETGLQNAYLRHTVSINANVAPATHGESKTEILGSGDGARVFQQFRLKQKPLTYTAATTGGAKTTLEIRVNDIKWREVPSFYGRSAEERIYVIKMDEDGSTYVQFGDGITGARLPSGVENVKAAYRVGIGMEGMVKANQLSSVLSPLPGLRKATNPTPATGGDDPELPEDIRRNAPLTVRTLDRIVSIKDYEDAANAFAGIGKARADLLWKGEEKAVCLTVAAADKGLVSNTLREKLIEAINAIRHSNIPVLVASYTKKYFNLNAGIKIHEDFLPETVFPNIRSALLKAFGFEARHFGQGVTPSEVMAVMQSVEGVVAVDLNNLGGQDPSKNEHCRLRAATAVWSNNTTPQPAEMLLIDPNNIHITAM
jgi:predicted phage baseplate assembly protein